MASIFILDGEPFTRDGIRSYLQETVEFDVIGEDNNGLAALEKIQALRPDVLITDLVLNGLDGLEVVRRLFMEMPSLKVVVHTRKIESCFVCRAVKYGVHAYIIKNSSREDLVKAIHSVLNGSSFFSPIVSSLMDQFDQSEDIYECLTTREREVLQQVAEGKSIIQITEALYISGRTVEKHRSNLMRKLGFHSQVELVKYALQRGLIPFHNSTETIQS